ncbi:MAG: VPLPA-CTERM sorting domain-containing protein [Pikeienuella sp.]
MKLGFAFAAMFLMLGATSGVSQAATCRSYQSDLVTQGADKTAASCFRGTTVADARESGALQVNVDQAFGFSDWGFAGASTGADKALMIADLGFAKINDNASRRGDFALDQTAFGRWSNVMLVLANTESANTGQNYLAYLLSPALAASGTYFTPFYSPTNFVKPGEISQFSVYVRNPVAAVPVPAALPLLLAGLAGLGFAARRKTA